MTVGRVLTFVSLTLLLASCATTSAPTDALANGYLALGNGWFDQKKWDQASQAYTQALRWNPQLKAAALNWARAKAEAGDPAAALARLDDLAASDPDNLVLAQYRAWLKAKKDGPASAADLYAVLAPRLTGDAATQFNAATCIQAAGRTAEALEVWKRWKALDGKGADGLTGLAQCLELLNDPDTAAAWGDVVAVLGDGDAKRFGPLTSQARALEKAHRADDALAAWDAALALKGTADAARAEAQFRRGSLLVLVVGDTAAGIQGLVDAWTAGYKDDAAWKALREDPRMTSVPALDLALAGVATPASGAKP